MTEFVEHLFHVPIVKFEVFNWKYKKNILLDMIEESNLDVPSNDYVLTNFYNQPSTNKFKFITEINNLLEDEFRFFVDEMSFASFSLLSTWFQVEKLGMTHTIHNHGSTGYSGVVFIEYDQYHHKPTTFLSPFNNFITGESFTTVPKGITEGSIIFFPSSINHYAPQNRSEVERKILSFNASVK